MADWREQYTYEGHLFLLAPEVIFQAQINQASITYPLTQVTFDTVTTGAYGDIKVGQTVLFGSSAGLGDLGRTRVRKVATSTILYIGWMSRGTIDSTGNLADDAYITVLDDYRIWPKTPRILKDGTLYKDYDLTYTVAPPVANGGVGVMALIDGNDEITVSFDGTDSFATAPTRTISSYAWDFDDGTPSSSASSTVSDVVFPKGFRWVKLTVTDSASQTHTTHIPVAAIGTSEDETSYTGAVITASSEFAAGNAGSKAFDNSTASWWTTAVGVTSATLKIQYPSAQIITKYDVDVTNLSPVYPTDWTFEGSNNGSVWVVLDTQTSQTFFTPNSRTYTLSNTVSYTYYRINITGSGDPDQVGLTELNLYAENTNYISNFSVSQQTITREGQIFAVNVHDSIPETTYPDGTLVMYMEREFYNFVEGSLAGPTGREAMKYIGWHHYDPAYGESSETGYITNTELTCTDTAGRMKALPAFSQVALRVGTGTTWMHLPSATTDRYMHYLLHWHSTVLDVTPYTESGTGGTYALPWFSSPAKNMWEQLKFRAASIAHELTVSMRNELKVLPDPQLQDAGDRTATVITDIDPQDYRSFEYTHQRPPRVYWLWSSAVVASTNYASVSGLAIQTVHSVAPGKAPALGSGELNQSEQLVVDQDELNAREGHRYARHNAEETYFNFDLVPAGDVGIEPASMTWVRATIGADQAAERGLTFTDEKFLPFEVIVNHMEEGTKEVNVLVERYLVGTPASTRIPETGDTLPDTPPITDWPWIDDPPGEDDDNGLYRGVSTLAIFSDAELMHITTDFGTPEASNGPSWNTTVDLTALSPALSGNYLEMVGDPFSPLYAGTGTTVNGWILTSTGIYSITDVFGMAAGPTLALQHTLASAGADYGAIGVGLATQNWVGAIISYKGSPGTKCIYTTDGGSTWTEVVITAFYNTDGVGFSASYKPPLFMSPYTAGLMYAGALTSTGGTPPGDLYRSADYGATWVVATDIDVTFGNYHGGVFNIPWHNNPNQLLSYHGNHVVGTSYSLHRTESNGTTITDISPSGYGPPGYGFWSLSVCPTDRQRVAFLGFNESTSQSAIFVSRDAGDTWEQATVAVAASSGFRSVAIASDPNIIYAWGTNLQLSYSQDFGVTWQDKTSKLAGSANIINILGG